MQAMIPVLEQNVTFIGIAEVEEVAFKKKKQSVLFRFLTSKTKKTKHTHKCKPSLESDQN